MPTSTSIHNHRHLDDLLQSARPFLREELDSVDKNLPPLLTILRSAGAGECWHRLGTFLDHLFHVYRVLKLWKAPDSVCLFGLFHSVYSNSYHDLAIFNPVTDREIVRRHVGSAAERLIHLFCIVPRHPLIHDDLVFRYTDSELREHLQASESSLRNVKEGLNKEECWRKKLQEIVPATGIKVPHIRTGEPVVVPRRVVAVFLLMTIADFADQYYGYQDMLYDNTDGRLEFTGNTNFDTLWPGNGKPGLWMNLMSRMAGVYTLLVREEAICMAERISDRHENGEVAGGEDIELIIPPVFESCTKILDPNEQIMARDIYWEAVNDDGWKKEKGEEMLVKCIEKNPFVGEPHVLLSQFYLSRGRFEEGEREAEKGLRVLLEWGCPWDKRVSWEGWVAWGRVLLNKAKERCWPHTSWGVISLGLIK
ncbi:uncharacterized protein LOC112523365 [Cynara cardunculus var. scolymus]|uniref:DUF6817 domain-containing protein n=1 Tax=Cynara cardunculus var. scolymus TaxID=59895 RepID=A0A124SDM7_CYNCS|nr:uncharacterized protein LOC112523365 [Cynara cardunculus var. scolymus]KVH97420.1 hypothetical protein Ccrd_000462 [Cynara cardunculus var. scolymus]